MKLYNANLSPYASRVRLAIYATGLNVEIVPPPAQLGSDAYKQVNPIGKVPALGFDDGTVLPESDVIVQYIDEKSGGKLSPGTAEGRAKARLIGRIADLYIHPGLGTIFRQLGATERDPAKIAEGAAEAKKGLALLEHYIEGGAYAIGGRLSHADCMVVPTIFFISAILPRIGEANPFAATPKVGAYWAAVQKDASVARVVKEIAEALAERMKKG